MIYPANNHGDWQLSVFGCLVTNGHDSRGTFKNKNEQMKATLKEFEGCFALELGAENMAEAALLVRMGMNHTQIRVSNANVCNGGQFEFSIVLGKSRRSSPTVLKRK